MAKGFRSSDQAKDHGVRDAEGIIGEAVEHLKLAGSGREDFEEVPRDDLRRVAVAWALSRKTSLKQGWITERLSMRSADNVSVQVRKFTLRPEKELPKEIRRWKKNG